MRLYERIASALIGTPLQRPAQGLRWVSRLPQRLKHPELREIYLEDDRIRGLMKRAISNGMNCIDVGCHLGSILQEFVDLSPKGHHAAVEPLPYKAAWLRRKYPAVDVHQVALGDEDGFVDFFFNHRMSGFSGLRPHRPSDETEKLVVPCKRLDDLIPEDRSIGFLKVDVEGGEYFVLRGAKRMIAKNRPVILFECTRSGLASYALSPAQVFSLIVDEFRYGLFLIDDWLHGRAPLAFPEFERSMKYPFRAFNYVAAPASASR